MSDELTPEEEAILNDNPTKEDRLAILVSPKFFEVVVGQLFPPTGYSQMPEFLKVIGETLDSRWSERQGRLIDHDEEGSMESKKREGYF